MQSNPDYKYFDLGVSLTWYGFYDPSLPWDTSLKTATYSIDGGSPISFNTLVDVANRTQTDKPTGVRYNQVLFQTDDLPNTNHNLQVTFQGTNSSTPLTLEFLVVNPNPREGADSATSVAPSTQTSSSGNPNATNPALPTTSASPRKVSNLGTIVGAVVGSVAIVLLLAILFVFLRRRQKNGYQRPTSVLAPDMAEPVHPSETITTQNRSYTHPSGATSSNTFNSLSVNTDASYVVPSQASDPFSDSSRPQAPPSIQSYGMSRVELTPSGRIIHSDEAALSNSGKGRIPMHIENTVIQDEDSGVRLPHSPDQHRVEILPPSYSRD